MAKKIKNKFATVPTETAEAAAPVAEEVAPVEEPSAPVLDDISFEPVAEEVSTGCIFPIYCFKKNLYVIICVS